MEYTFYVLKSERNRRYYIGSAENISERVAKHNRGEVQSTRAHRPWKVVYTEELPTRQEARQRELQVKSWKSRKAIERLIGPIV
ncbi:MAG: GIY-YIG nuclease family protein [Patescibacteria group bacterium]